MKPRELARVARREGTNLDCGPWVHKAEQCPKEDFKREAERDLTGNETEPLSLRGGSHKPNPLLVEAPSEPPRGLLERKLDHPRPITLKPSLMAFEKASSAETRLAGTPMPFARCTQSRVGRLMSNKSAARGPGGPTPRPANSRCSTAYVRLAKTTVVTFRPSRAIVHSACTVYILLPSAVRHNTRRVGQATAAPTASGRAIPIEPPVFPSQSWGGAPVVAAIRPRARRRNPIHRNFIH